MLVGARLVVSSEVEEGAKLNETRVKELTGGDTITARFLHQEYFEFIPVFKLWICGNHKPVIRGTDLGIWRRIRLIPFTVTIPESEVDPQLTNKLRQELPGILSWAIAGCIAWQREGLKPPRVVVEATAAYRSESDLIGQFLEECCVLAPAAETSATVIYGRYKAWADANGTRPITSSMLTRKLVELGIQTRRSGGTWFVGVSVPPS
ncbi:MAG: hypothetical protein HQL87_10795 [Magnetococcales bacterium]|nr:hypothetical protein [Magnetococcales bacterium]